MAELLIQYDIEYIYIGDLERSKYGLQPQVIRKFDRLMSKVYDQEGVLIYQRQ